VPTDFRRGRSIMNGLDSFFSRQNRTMRANLRQNEDNKNAKNSIKAANSNTYSTKKGKK